MPHVTVHYTANLQGLDADALLAAINRALLASGEFGPLAIKSRAMHLDSYRVGDHDDGHGFVHAVLKVLPGRSPQLRQALSKSVLDAMQAVVPGQDIHTQFCVELDEIDADTYTKAVVACAAPPENP